MVLKPIPNPPDTEGRLYLFAVMDFHLAFEKGQVKVEWGFTYLITVKNTEGGDL